MAYTLVYDEPKSAHEVVGSKEGFRALVSPYDKKIYVHGGRGIAALKNVRTYDPVKNHFTIVNESCPSGVYNHTLVPYKNYLISYGG